MLIGYARISKGEDQNPDLQLRAFKAAGVERTFVEGASGARWDRKELQRALDQLRSGDVLVVWKLDRLGRSLKDLLILLEGLEQRGVGFRSLTENIDTTTPAGRMFLQMCGAFAEYERGMLRERTLAGLAAAREQGRVGGRRPKLTPAQRQEIVRAVQEERHTAASAARLFGVHPSTITRLLNEARLVEPREVSRRK